MLLMSDFDGCIKDTKAEDGSALIHKKTQHERHCTMHDCRCKILSGFDVFTLLPWFLSA